jgi:hypothetical protein
LTRRRQAREEPWIGGVGKVRTISVTKNKILSPAFGGEFSSQVSGQWNRLKPFFLLDWLRKISFTVISSKEWMDA